MVSTKQNPSRVLKDKEKRIIAEEQAISIGRKFLEQYNSGVTFENIAMDNGSWLVTFTVGYQAERRTMRISPKSGSILSLVDVK